MLRGGWLDLGSVTEAVTRFLDVLLSAETMTKMDLRHLSKCFPVLEFLAVKF